MPTIGAVPLVTSVPSGVPVGVVTPASELVTGIPVVVCDAPNNCRATGLGGVSAGMAIVPGTAMVAERTGFVPADAVTPIVDGRYANAAALTPNGSVVYGVWAECDYRGNCTSSVAGLPTYRMATASGRSVAPQNDARASRSVPPAQIAIQPALPGVAVGNATPRVECDFRGNCIDYRY
ncbi:MAG: hypothetical protein FJX54_11490 [Alphaproteobacteria bacterium]|nr:hypothetical protein [Alphaproteobacteria bacterium]